MSLHEVFQWLNKFLSLIVKKLTNVTSRDAAAALMCKLGCFTELLQSRALANVPTDLQANRKSYTIL